jgi:hypothetical protein
MSGRMTTVFGAIVLIALAGLDYGAAANSQPEGQSLGVAEHVMNRFAQAKAALGLAPPPAPEPAAALSGPATAVIEAAISDADRLAADVTAPAAAQEAKPKPEHAKKAAKKGAITVGKGTCAKRGGTGKFCSISD